MAPRVTSWMARSVGYDVSVEPPSFGAGNDRGSMGRAAPHANGFAADAVDVTWTTNAPAGGACTVTGGAVSYNVPGGDRASGSTTHGLGVGVEDFL